MYMGDCFTTCFGPKGPLQATYISKLLRIVLIFTINHFVLKGNWGVYRLHFLYISRPARCKNSYNESLLIIKCSTCFGFLSPSSGTTFF